MADQVDDLGQMAYEAARAARLGRRPSDEVVEWADLNDGTRGMWRAAAVAVIDNLPTTGPTLLAGLLLDAERRGERQPGPGPLYPATNAPWVDPPVSGPVADFIRECFAWTHEVRSADHAMVTRQLAALNARGIEPEWLQDQFARVQQQLATLAIRVDTVVNLMAGRGGQPSNADLLARIDALIGAVETVPSREWHRKQAERDREQSRQYGFETGRKIGLAEREAELLEQGWTPPGAVLESVLEPARHEISAYEVWRDALMMATQHRIGADGDLDETASAAVWFWDRLLEGPPGFQGEYFRPVDQLTERERWERAQVASEHEAASRPADAVFVGGEDDRAEPY